MLVRPNVFRISALGNNSRLWPNRTIGIKLMSTICLVVILALFALQARITLRADSNSTSLFDKRHFWSNSHCCAHNFYIRNTFPISFYPFLSLSSHKTGSRYLSNKWYNDKK